MVRWGYSGGGLAGSLLLVLSLCGCGTGDDVEAYALEEEGGSRSALDCGDFKMQEDCFDADSCIWLNKSCQTADMVCRRIKNDRQCELATRCRLCDGYCIGATSRCWAVPTIPCSDWPYDQCPQSRCKQCPADFSCIEKGESCNDSVTCSNYTTEYGCEDKGCHWCAYGNTCTDGSDQCESPKCDSSSTKSMCETLVDCYWCPWTGTQNACISLADTQCPPVQCGLIRGSSHSETESLCKNNGCTYCSSGKCAADRNACTSSVPSSAPCSSPLKDVCLDDDRCDWNELDARCRFSCGNYFSADHCRSAGCYWYSYESGGGVCQNDLSEPAPLDYECGKQSESYCNGHCAWCLEYKNNVLTGSCVDTSDRTSCLNTCEEYPEGACKQSGRCDWCASTGTCANAGRCKGADRCISGVSKWCDVYDRCIAQYDECPACADLAQQDACRAAPVCSWCSLVGMCSEETCPQSCEAVTGKSLCDGASSCSWCDGTCQTGKCGDDDDDDEEEEEEDEDCFDKPWCKGLVGGGLGGLGLGAWWLATTPKPAAPPPAEPPPSEPPPSEPPLSEKCLSLLYFVSHAAGCCSLPDALPGFRYLCTPDSIFIIGPTDPIPSFESRSKTSSDDGIHLLGTGTDKSELTEEEFAEVHDSSDDKDDKDDIDGEDEYDRDVREDGEDEYENNESRSSANEDVRFEVEPTYVCHGQRERDCNDAPNCQWFEGTCQQDVWVERMLAESTSATGGGLGPIEWAPTCQVRLHNGFSEWMLVDMRDNVVGYCDGRPLESANPGLTDEQIDAQCRRERDACVEQYGTCLGAYDCLSPMCRNDWMGGIPESWDRSCQSTLQVSTDETQLASACERERNRCVERHGACRRAYTCLSRQCRDDWMGAIPSAWDRKCDPGR